MKDGTERKNGPAIAEIRKITIPKVETITLSNGIPIHVINAGTQEIVKIELVSFAGRAFEETKLTAKPTASLIKEGTLTKSSEQIADFVDFYGANLVTRSGMDTSSISLYSLTKYLPELLPIYLDVIMNPVFPEEELERIKTLNAQNLKIELAKNDVKAYRQITEHIFGSDHIYGYNSNPEDYTNISRESVVNHYKKSYINDSTEIFVAGRLSDADLKLIVQHLEQLLVTPKAKIIYSPNQEITAGRFDYYAEKDHQTALRIGKKVVPRTHHDFHDLFFTNTVLGGYFGSRLMKEVRENLGYTYGIYTLIDAMKFEGSWLLSAEVANDYLEKTITACQSEIKKLQDSVIGPKEIKMVRNYLMGHYMTMVDGPFKTAQLLKMLRISGLNFDYFKEFVDQTKNIKGHRVRDIAGKYFSMDDLITVTVGSN